MSESIKTVSEGGAAQQVNVERLLEPVRLLFLSDETLRIRCEQQNQCQQSCQRPLRNVQLREFHCKSLTVHAAEFSLKRHVHSTPT
jgi:hypothetical protein